MTSPKSIEEEIKAPHVAHHDDDDEEEEVHDDLEKDTKGNDKLEEALDTTESTTNTTTVSLYSNIPIANSPMDVFCSKFVLFQLFFNIIASFIGPLGTFYLLFGYLSQGPYEWYSGPLVGVVVGSLAGSPLLIFALMPVGLPEAVQKGWFPKISKDKCQKLLPICIDWKWASARNLVWTIVLIGIPLVPVALLIARFGFGRPTLTTWQLIWFNVVYEVVLAIPVALLGLLGYAVEEHLDSILERMSQDPNPCRRMTKRVLSSLKMTVCPPS